jgi:hypothetical protein
MCVRRPAAAREDLIEHGARFNLVDVEEAPADGRTPGTSGTSKLIYEQPFGPVLYAVIVRFNATKRALVTDFDQACRRDGRSQRCVEQFFFQRALSRE